MTDFFLTELDHRSADGIEVSLLWSRSTNRLKVAVEDSRSGECFEVHAPAEKALDVFRLRSRTRRPLREDSPAPP